MSEFDPPEDTFDRDGYSIVINGEDTYKQIANILLLDGRPVVFPWTDQEGTRLDILMVFGPDQLGELGEGMSAGTDLFVATRFGMFGFELNGQWKAPSYVAEKLGLVRSNPLGKPLSELINGVAKALIPRYYE
jgi:hypothetical protein